MDSDRARGLLSQERDRLAGIRAEMVGAHGGSGEAPVEEPSSYSQHPADVGSETFDRERDLTILDSVEGELADVEHALVRLDDGTYGTCEACGQAIPDERLQALPATRFCLADQTVAERELRTSSPHELVEDEDEDDYDASTGA